MNETRRSRRQPKPTPRYVSWRGLQMVTASRDRTGTSCDSLGTDSVHKVSEWLTRCGISNLAVADCRSSASGDTDVPAADGDVMDNQQVVVVNCTNGTSLDADIPAADRDVMDNQQVVVVDCSNGASLDTDNPAADGDATDNQQVVMDCTNSVSGDTDIPAADRDVTDNQEVVVDCSKGASIDTDIPAADGDVTDNQQVVMDCTNSVSGDIDIPAADRDVTDNQEVVVDCTYGASLDADVPAADGDVTDKQQVVVVDCSNGASLDTDNPAADGDVTDNQQVVMDCTNSVSGDIDIPAADRDVTDNQEVVVDCTYGASFDAYIPAADGDVTDNQQVVVVDCSNGASLDTDNPAADGDVTDNQQVVVDCTNGASLDTDVPAAECVYPSGVVHDDQSCGYVSDSQDGSLCSEIFDYCGIPLKDPPHEVAPEQRSYRLVDYSSSDEDDARLTTDDNCEVTSGPNHAALGIDPPYLANESHRTSATTHAILSACSSVDTSSLHEQPAIGQQSSSDSDSGLRHHDTLSGVTVYSKSCGDKGKNRKLPCFFCDKFVFSMPRHLQRVHGSLCEVAEVCAQSSKEDVKLGLQKLSHQGTFKYNSNVLQQGSGVLLVARAPKRKRTPDAFVPCMFCLQFFVKDELYRHCKVCNFKPIDAPEKGFVALGRALLEGSGPGKVNKELQNTVISRMRIDRLKRVAVSDTLIVKLGSMLLHKLGHKRACDISARMRELARLLVRMPSDGRRVTVSDLLSGQNFDKVVTAIESEAGSTVDESGRRLFQRPAFVIKVAGSLLKCAHLKQGTALRSGDTVALKEAADFITLYRGELTDRLVSAAHASYRIKGNKLTEYPDEADFKTLKSYLVKQITKVAAGLPNSGDAQAWRNLAELTMTRILVFNARRGAEVSELKLSDFAKVTADVDPAWAKYLTPVEQQLLCRLKVVQVIGKRTRPVPILLTEDMYSSMNVLNATRVQCGVCEGNKFFFALPASATAHLRFYDVLKRVALQAKLKKPENLTTTRLRKHLATVAQMIDMTPNELQWLSGHMGHDVSTHKRNYRLHDNRIELTKVGHLLTALDSGNLLHRKNSLLEDGSDVENDPEEGMSSQCKTSRPVVASDEEAVCLSSGTVTATKRSASMGCSRSRTGIKATSCKTRGEKRHRAIIESDSDVEDDVATSKDQQSSVQPTAGTQGSDIDSDSDTGTVPIRSGNAKGTRQKIRRKKWRQIVNDEDSDGAPGALNSATDEEPIAQEPAAAVASRTPARRSSGTRLKWSEGELAFLRKQFGHLHRPPSFKDIREAQRRMPSLKKRSLPQIKTRAWTLLRASSSTANGRRR